MLRAVRLRVAGGGIAVAAAAAALRAAQSVRCASAAAASEVVSFHRRVLPLPSIQFSSPEGRAVFRETLAEGNLDGSYFALAEHFSTQSDPSFCGLTTLAMSLNALGVDPRRIWKGPWRWYTEELLDCCAPTESVRSRGISFREFIGYAECQDLNVVAVQGGTPEFLEERFRRTLQSVSSASNMSGGSIGAVLVCSYSRAVLGQTGDGHFSPIAAYNSKRDLALVMDVARFKYPPHWVPVPRLFDAMRPLDSATGEARGYFLLSYSSRGKCPLRTPPRETFHQHDRERSNANTHVHGPQCKH